LDHRRGRASASDDEPTELLVEAMRRDCSNPARKKIGCGVDAGSIGPIERGSIADFEPGGSRAISDRVPPQCHASPLPAHP
jgi:hypothetical protein